MMIAGSLQMFWSGSILLLLAMATLGQRAGAQTSDTDVTATSAPSTAASVAICTPEVAACFSDDTCQSCLSAGSDSAAYDECTAIADSSCDGSMDAACCLDDLSDFDCLENEAFMGFVACTLEDRGCSTEFACDGAEAQGVTGAGAAVFGDGSMVIAVSCASIAMLPLLCS